MHTYMQHQRWPGLAGIIEIQLDAFSSTLAIRIGSCALGATFVVAATSCLVDVAEMVATVLTSRTNNFVRVAFVLSLGLLPVDLASNFPVPLGSIA